MYIFVCLLVFCILIYYDNQIKQLYQHKRLTKFKDPTIRSLSVEFPEFSLKAKIDDLFGLVLLEMSKLLYTSGAFDVTLVTSVFRLVVIAPSSFLL